MKFKQDKPAVSDECRSGYCGRCRREDCRCNKCVHLFAKDGIGAARVYSAWARANNVKPLHLNLAKADYKVVARAAEAIRTVAPKIALLLDQEYENKLPKDSLSCAIRSYNINATVQKWKPSYINPNKADYRVFLNAAARCREAHPETSDILYEEGFRRKPAKTQAEDRWIPGMAAREDNAFIGAGAPSIGKPE